MKKFFLVFTVYFIVIGLFISFISKDKQNINHNQEVNPLIKNRQEIYKVINDKKLNSTKEGKQKIALFRKITCTFIGEACFDDSQKTNVEKSFAGLISKVIFLPLSHPPASGVYWAYSGLQNSGFLPKTYAAEGIGFSTIKGFSDIWNLFRDLSYMLLVVVLIAIGFMVMFRAKINPQTVISVENALPRIVVSLILITFSFAIAGFLIDLMYVVTALMISVLARDVNNISVPDLQNQYLNSSFFDLYIRDARIRLPWSTSIADIFVSSIYKVIPWQLDIMARTITGFLTIPLSNLIGSGKLVELLGTALNDIPPLGDLPQILLKPIAVIIIYGTVFIWGFLNFLEIIMNFLLFFSFVFITIRISVILFFSYIKLLLLIILGPFMLLFESLGKPGFKTWFMGIIGNLIPFPITITVFLLAYIINTQANDVGMVGRLPYLYGIESSGFKFLVALGLVFLIPDIIKMVKELLGIKDLPIALGIGTYFGGLATGVGGATSLLGQYGSIMLAAGYIPGVNKFVKKLQAKDDNVDLNPRKVSQGDATKSG